MDDKPRYTRYRKVSSAFWNDAGVLRLSDRGKLAFLFILTHPNMTSLGMMRATMSGLAEELGWEVKAFREAFGEAFREGMVEASTEAPLIALPNFLKHNKPESPNVVKSWERILPELPECELKTQQMQRVKAFTEALPKAFREALPEAFGKPYPNPQPNPDPDPDPYKRSNHKAIGGECERGKAVEAVGNVALRCIADFNPVQEHEPDDTLGYHRALISEATGGAFKWRGGHLMRLEGILAHTRGPALIRERIVDALSNSESEAIRDPAAFANSALVELARELGVTI
jgi:hypothetical protein